MHTIKNLTEKSVLVRMNSGMEFFIGPKGKVDAVAESEIRGNSVLDKLRTRGVLVISDGTKVEVKQKGASKTAEQSEKDTSKNTGREAEGKESADAKEHSDSHPRLRK